MQEILTAVTYLVVWFICEKVICIESGLTKLLISLGSAVGVYILMAVKEHKEGFGKYNSYLHRVRGKLLLKTFFRQF